MNDEDAASANAEMRYIALELMKIAADRGQGFEELADEFISNVNRLDSLIRSRSKRKLKQNLKSSLKALDNERRNGL